MRGIPEIQLQKLLCEGFLVSRDFLCDSGKKIKILSIGEWNRGSGPDFKNCRIRQGSREEVGDIEVHKSIGEWYEHRHHLDPHYENVELHLTLFRGRCCRRNSIHD